MTQETSTRKSVSHFRLALAYRFNLRPDQSRLSDIDEDIRDGVEVRGTNLWVLMLAIFIASIGLDVNSTAVIIGAMLISPLMGPIMGVGYGVGIDDHLLIKKALANLLISFLIALFTSTLYFLISPLSTAQSELLARTTPTIWDVLIALFGGLAGIIAMTRKEKSNVIPGVAIATALMPPLCTAGYGIANGSLEMFLGAFYLFFINCVFIALATLLLIRYIRPPRKKYEDEARGQKIKVYIYIVVLVTLLPSIYLAYGMVTKVMFNSKAHEFIKNELNFENSFIARQNISADKHQIDITLVGQKISDEKLAEIAQKLPTYKLKDAKFTVHQNVIQELDEASLKKSLLAEVLHSNQKALNTENTQVLALKSAIASLKALQDQHADNLKEEQKLFEELVAQYPEIKQLSTARATEYQANQTSHASVLLVNITTRKVFSRTERRRISAWLKVRTGVDKVKLSIERL